MSRTLAQALMVTRRSDRKERLSPQPTLGMHSPDNSNSSVSLDVNYNERYYQAQIAHLQTSLVKEHALFVRVVRD
ncbi:hypothetical protein FRC17_006702 [Serendipita sp. 399]|nr:hypothetical protein FRC17_006702 [Serendipita sp. 399]